MNSSLSKRVPIVKPLSRNRIESDALIFLAQHQVESLHQAQPVDIEQIFELDIPKVIPGLKTGYVDLTEIGPGVMGYTDAEKQVSFVHKELYEAAIKNPESPVARRFRATVAHEVSHCIYHYKYLRGFKSASSLTGNGLMRVSRDNIPAYMDPEWQAWEKAGALLMPKPIIEKLRKEGCSIEQIAEILNLNPAFVGNRIKRLDKQKK